MFSMNRVGLVWSGDHRGLVTNVVRGEWGFGGVVITDQASYPQAFPQSCLNGISSTTEVVPAMATWQKALTGVDVVAGVAAVAGAWAIVRNMRRTKAKVSDEAQGETGDKNDEVEA